MDLKEVENNILQIMQDKKVLNRVQLESKWKHFMMEYPLIFISVQKEDVDINMLRSMIAKIAQIKNGEKTHEQAEKEFGNTLAEKYLYTKFEKPSEKELEIAYGKALENQKMNRVSIINIVFLDFV